ncbi:proteoglycan 4-like isoform X2 [Sycon ciliatum]|uniref:proteoglycan 4-like isoform X2 n=1 Tax=Sycon ciliatum TaxID=27933 RepID=UPI0031F5F48E
MVRVNISDEGEAEEEGTTSIFSCCQPRILNKEPSVIPQDSYAVRGPSTQNLIADQTTGSSDRVHIAGQGARQSPTTQHAPQGTRSSPDVTPGTPPETENGDDSQQNNSGGPSFLGKTFASFNVLHSKWRNKSDSPTGSNGSKSMSKSLEDLSQVDTGAAPANGKVKLMPPPHPQPYARHKSSQEASANQSAKGKAPPGYEDVQVRPPVKQRSHSNTAGKSSREHVSQVAKDDNNPTASAAVLPIGGGLLKRVKKPSVGQRRTEPTKTDSTEGDPTSDKTTNPTAASSDHEADQTPQKLIIHPAPVELAYNQVTVQPKPSSNSDQQKSSRAASAYAISGPLKSPPKKPKQPEGIGASPATPTSPLSSSVSSTSVALPTQSSTTTKQATPSTPPSPAHRRRALSSNRHGKKVKGSNGQEQAQVPLPQPSSDYESIAITGKSDVQVPAKETTAQTPLAGMKRYGEPHPKTKALPEDPSHDYDELDDCASKQHPKPNDVYSVVEKKQALKPPPKDTYSIVDKKSTSPPKPSDTYSVIDKAKPPATSAPPAAAAAAVPLPTPKDLYSIPDRKAPNQPAPTELYSAVDKKPAKGDKLVYTELAFEGEQQEQPNHAAVKKPTPAPVAPTTVYETLDMDVKAGDARLPQRTVAGLREDDSDYEDIEGATQMGKAKGAK